MKSRPCVLAPPMCRDRLIAIWERCLSPGATHFSTTGGNGSFYSGADTKPVALYARVNVEQAYANCSSSVEPARATVELAPLEITWATSSKYPVPTNR